MVYKIDGSSHKNGVAGEESLLKFFNDENNFSFISNSLKKWGKVENFQKFNFIFRGGTQNREDIYCANNDIKISIKTKKKINNIYKGTFDLINTSSLSKVISKDNIKCLKLIKEWEDLLKEAKKNKNLNKQSVKNIVSKYCNSMLNTITGADIKSIFNAILLKEKDVIEVIRDYKNEVFESIEKSDLHFLEYHWFEKELNTNIDLKQKITSNKNSSFIKNINDENGLFRIRIVLNNGLSALMRELNLETKLKNKNNTSSLTIKIQVDKIREVIDKYDLNYKK